MPVYDIFSLSFQNFAWRRTLFSSSLGSAFPEHTERHSSNRCSIASLFNVEGERERARSIPCVMRKDKTNHRRENMVNFFPITYNMAETSDDKFEQIWFASVKRFACPWREEFENENDKSRIASFTCTKLRCGSTRLIKIICRKKNEKQKRKWKNLFSLSILPLHFFYNSSPWKKISKNYPITQRFR